MLIDAGPGSAKDTVVRYLKGAGVSRIDYLVFTQPHENRTTLLLHQIHNVPDATREIITRSQKGFISSIRQVADKVRIRPCISKEGFSSEA